MKEDWSFVLQTVAEERVSKVRENDYVKYVCELQNLLNTIDVST